MKKAEILNYLSHTYIGYICIRKNYIVKQALNKLNDIHLTKQSKQWRHFLLTQPLNKFIVDIKKELENEKS